MQIFDFPKAIFGNFKFKKFLSHLAVSFLETIF